MKPQRETDRQTETQPIRWTDRQVDSDANRQEAGGFRAAATERCAAAAAGGDDGFMLQLSAL